MRAEAAPLLAEVPAFAELAEADLLALADACQELHVRGGDLLMAEESRDDRLLILLRGRLELSRGRGERRRAEVGPGSVVGLPSALQDGPGTGAVRALERSQLAVLRASAIELLSVSHAPIGLALRAAVVSRLLDDLQNRQLALGDLRP